MVILTGATRETLHVQHSAVAASRGLSYQRIARVNTPGGEVIRIWKVHSIIAYNVLGQLVSYIALIIHLSEYHVVSKVTTKDEEIRKMG